jgi:hypothetical protein
MNNMAKEKISTKKSMAMYGPSPLEKILPILEEMKYIQARLRSLYYSAPKVNKEDAKVLDNGC